MSRKCQLTNSSLDEVGVSLHFVHCDLVHCSGNGFGSASSLNMIKEKVSSALMPRSMRSTPVSECIDGMLPGVDHVGVAMGGKAISLIARRNIDVLKLFGVCPFIV